MPEIKIVLTLDEINLILEALGSMPFVRVHQLIGKIQQQAQAQLQAAQDQQTLSTTAETKTITGDPNER